MMLQDGQTISDDCTDRTDPFTRQTDQITVQIIQIMLTRWKYHTKYNIRSLYRSDHTTVHITQTILYVGQIRSAHCTDHTDHLGTPFELGEAGGPTEKLRP